MHTEYLALYQAGEAEITEKKSRFIAIVQPIENEEEAIEFIEKIRKKYWDARHHCFAYVQGERFEVQRCSDDGEPSGTAGKPILDVIMGKQVHDVLVIVIRYFGGTLLGTGGLVRAYSQATKDGLEASYIITKKLGIKLDIQTDYTGLGKIQYILGQRGITVIESVYEADVHMVSMVPIGEKAVVIQEVIEATNGKSKIEEIEQCWYANIDGKLEVFK